MISDVVFAVLGLTAKLSGGWNKSGLASFSAAVDGLTSGDGSLQEAIMNLGLAQPPLDASHKAEYNTLAGT